MSPFDAHAAASRELACCEAAFDAAAAMMQATDLTDKVALLNQYRARVSEARATETKAHEAAWETQRAGLAGLAA